MRAATFDVLSSVFCFFYGASGRATSSSLVFKSKLKENRLIRLCALQQQQQLFQQSIGQTKKVTTHFARLASIDGKPNQTKLS